jgi:hypothetical protein
MLRTIIFKERLQDGSWGIRRLPMIGKNHRPDLLQFKQGLGTLDPAGIPLVTETLPAIKPIEEGRNE